MLKQIRLNSYENQQRAQEEVAGLKLAFSTSELSLRPGFKVYASPYRGEFIVFIEADVNTNDNGFLSVIVARHLASFCKAPANFMQIAPAETSRRLRLQRRNPNALPEH